VGAAARAGKDRALAPDRDHPASRVHLMPPRIHIIGAGLAGLSAAVRLARDGARVRVHEATAQAGGRCRSYYDQATGLTIDNGNHLILSGNRAALDYAETIGTRSRLLGPDKAEFPFIDLADGRRWTLQLGDARIPWWVLDAGRRVPDTGALDYLRYAPLLWASAGRTVCEQVNCAGPLYQRLVQPLLVAALNIQPSEGSAKLAGVILRETLAAGGRACRPLIARDGLSAALIEPAIEFVRTRNGAFHFEHELRKLELVDGRVAALDFGRDRIEMEPGDIVILAVPPWIASSLMGELATPREFRAIVNAHFRCEPPRNFPAMIGVLNGLVEWIFAFPGRLAVTISAGDRLLATPRVELARMIWRDVAAVAAIADPLPPWQIVRERRATFAATPHEDARRPGPRTAWSNLFLAGDWTQTGLPATIEGAIRSGYRAAALVMQGGDK
jgi:squalene-associated FAD-dependent desaturase